MKKSEINTEIETNTKRYADAEIAFAAIRADAVKCGIIGKKAIAAFQTGIYVIAMEQQFQPVYVITKSDSGELTAIRMDVVHQEWCKHLKKWMAI